MTGSPERAAVFAVLADFFHRRREPLLERWEVGARERIGLSIVKRLCELLDAGLELASGAEGSLFQVVLPRRYPK